MNKTNCKVSLSQRLKRAVALTLVIILTITTIPAITTTARELTQSTNRFSIYNNDPSPGVGEGINVITGNFSRGYIDIELPQG